MTGQNVGYIRVSSIGQNTERQLADVKLDMIFEDKISGKNLDRPQLDACLKHLRDGDTLHVHSIDRLARNLQDLLNTVTQLVNRGVSVAFHKENLTFKAGKAGNDSAMQVLMLQMLGAVAQFERTLIRERQREGIDQAKQRGQKLGAPAKLSQTQIDEIKALLSVAGADKSSIAKQFGISRPTLYKLVSDAKLSIDNQ
jgi:DNA invertase Pin-like site-specific DNA recombinase